MASWILSSAVAQGVRVILETSGAKAILDASYDRNYGARPVERYLQQTVVTELSKMLISGKLASGSTVHIEAVSDADAETTTGSLPSNKRARTLNYRIEKTISIDGEEGNEWMEVEDVD